MSSLGSPLNLNFPLNREKIDKIVFYPLDRLKEKYEKSGFKLIDFFNKDTKNITVYNDDELINAESALGRTLFGPIPVGHQREFFRDKKNVWIFHEGWTESGVDRTVTIRYEVREDGVYKKFSGTGYTKIEGEELENFRKALHSYLDVVKNTLYK